MVKLDIWLAIVLIARLDSHGAMTIASAATVLQAALKVRPRTSWTLSCLRWVAAVDSPAGLLNTMAVVLAATATAAASALSSPGSVARPAVLHPGRVATAAATVATATRQLLLLGLVLVVPVLVAHTIKVAVMATAVPHRGLLPLQLLELRMAMATTELATTRVLQLLVTERPAMVLLDTALLRLLLALLPAWVLYSRPTDLPEALLLHRPHHLAQCLHHLLRVMSLLLHRRAMFPLRPLLQRKRCANLSHL